MDRYWVIVMRWTFRGPLGDPLPRPWVIVMRWIFGDPLGDSPPRPIAAAALNDETFEDEDKSGATASGSIAGTACVNAGSTRPPFPRRSFLADLAICKLTSRAGVRSF